MSTPGSPVLVVHGHREEEGQGQKGLISAECVARLSAAERAARDCGVGDVLLSGAGAKGFPSEAEQMADLWSGPAIRLWLDQSSHEVAGAAQAATKWARQMRAQELIVVSSWWHVSLRLYYGEAKELGIQVRHITCPRMKGLRSHLKGELRHLPRVLRPSSSRLRNGVRDWQPSAETSVRSKLAELQLEAERQILAG